MDGFSPGSAALMWRSPIAVPENSMQQIGELLLGQAGLADQCA
jgi:hypothetical protein